MFYEFCLLIGQLVRDAFLFLGIFIAVFLGVIGILTFSSEALEAFLYISFIIYLVFLFGE